VELSAYGTLPRAKVLNTAVAVGLYTPVTVAQVVTGVSFGPSSSLAGEYPTTETSKEEQRNEDIAAVDAKKNKILIGTTILTVSGTLPEGGGGGIDPEDIILPATDEVDGEVEYGYPDNMLEGTGMNATTLLAALGMASGNLDSQLAAIPGLAGTDAAAKISLTPAGSAYAYTYDGTLYCSRSDVNDVFGASNVTKWADLDNDADATKITARVTRAISWATNEINDRLRDSAYTVPFNGSALPVIVDLAATLAGIWLYRARGTDDETNPDKFTWHWQRVDQTINEILAGKRKLNTSTVAKVGVSAPFVC
jgi:hypothetical protein